MLHDATVNAYVACTTVILSVATLICYMNIHFQVAPSFWFSNTKYGNKIQKLSPWLEQ